MSPPSPPLLIFPYSTLNNIFINPCIFGASYRQDTPILSYELSVFTTVHLTCKMSLSCPVSCLFSQQSDTPVTCLLSSLFPYSTLGNTFINPCIFGASYILLMPLYCPVSSLFLQQSDFPSTSFHLISLHPYSTLGSIFINKVTCIFGASYKYM